MFLNSNEDSGFSSVIEKNLTQNENATLVYYERGSQRILHLGEIIVVFLLAPFINKGEYLRFW